MARVMSKVVRIPAIFLGKVLERVESEIVSTASDLFCVSISVKLEAFIASSVNFPQRLTDSLIFKRSLALLVPQFICLANIYFADFWE